MIKPATSLGRPPFCILILIEAFFNSHLPTVRSLIDIISLSIMFLGAIMCDIHTLGLTPDLFRYIGLHAHYVTISWRVVHPFTRLLHCP